jgi:hypothetical protein
MEAGIFFILPSSRGYLIQPNRNILLSPSFSPISYSTSPLPTQVILAPLIINRLLLPSFLLSFFPFFLPTSLPSFIPSFLPSFLPSLLFYFLTSFLPSFFTSLLPSILPSFFTSLLPSFLPFLLPYFLPSFLPFFCSFLLSLISDFHPCTHIQPNAYTPKEDMLRLEFKKLQRNKLRFTEVDLRFCPWIILWSLGLLYV